MSAAASWSYTSTATFWSLLGRDDRTGVKTYAVPVSFACDYSAESVRMTDAKGIEFTTRQIVHTERSDLKQGDRLLIGESLVVDPIAAGSFEVRVVMRYADTFDQVADDYKVCT